MTGTRSPGLRVLVIATAANLVLGLVGWPGIYAYYARPVLPDPDGSCPPGFTFQSRTGHCLPIFHAGLWAAAGVTVFAVVTGTVVTVWLACILAWYWATRLDDLAWLHRHDRPFLTWPAARPRHRLPGGPPR